MELGQYDFRNIKFINRLNAEDIQEGKKYISNHENKLNQRDILVQKAERYVLYAHFITILIIVFLLIYLILQIKECSFCSISCYVLGLFLICMALVLKSYKMGLDTMIVNTYLEYKDFKTPNLHEREMYVVWKEKVKLEQYLRDFYFNQHIEIIDKWGNIDDFAKSDIWLHLWCKYSVQGIVYCKDEMISVKNIKSSTESKVVQYDIITDTIYIPFDTKGNVIV